MPASLRPQRLRETQGLASGTELAPGGAWATGRNHPGRVADPAEGDTRRRARRRV